MTEIISWFEKFSKEFSFLSKGCTTWIYIQRHSRLCSECSCSAVSVWHTCDTCSIVERASFSRKSRGGGPKLQGNRKYCTNVLNWKKSPIFSVEFPPWSFSGNGNWARSWRGSQFVETAPAVYLRRPCGDTLSRKWSCFQAGLHNWKPHTLTQ